MSGENENPIKYGVSRRDFLKLSAAGAIGLVLSELGVDRALAVEISPKMVNGVEVYGLDKSVSNKAEMQQLVGKLDRDFLKENDPFGIETSLFNYDELRDRWLLGNERYLTVVVKESVYRSYLEKKQ